MEQYIGDIEGYDNYLVRYDGVIFRIGKGNSCTAMKSRINSAGDLVVQLSRKTKRRTHHVRRLVASAFLDNYDPDLEVVCMNGDMTYCHVENLRVASAQDIKDHYAGLAAGCAKLGTEDMSRAFRLQEMHGHCKDEKEFLLSDEFTKYNDYTSYVQSVISKRFKLTRLAALALSEGFTWVAPCERIYKAEQLLADKITGITVK